MVKYFIDIRDVLEPPYLMLQVDEVNFIYKELNLMQIIRHVFEDGNLNLHGCNYQGEYTQDNFINGKITNLVNESLMNHPELNKYVISNLIGDIYDEVSELLFSNVGVYQREFHVISVLPSGTLTIVVDEENANGSNWV